MAVKVIMSRSIVFITNATKQTLSRSSSSVIPRGFLSRSPLVSMSIFFPTPLPTAEIFRRFGTASELKNQSKTSIINDYDKLEEGLDFEHWMVRVCDIKHDIMSRDEIIDQYIKILAQIVGSEDEARKRIYSVSTKHYFGFGAILSEELSKKLKELPQVMVVLPDFYEDAANKLYPGEPFIDGKVVPYDPKYHEAYLRYANHVISKPIPMVVREKRAQVRRLHN